MTHTEYEVENQHLPHSPLSREALNSLDLNDLFSHFFLQNSARSWSSLGPFEFDLLSTTLIFRCLSLKTADTKACKALKLAIWLLAPAITVSLQTSWTGAFVGVMLATTGHWFLNRLMEYRGHEVGYLRWLSALAPISSAELSLAFPNIRTRARSLARGRDLVYGDVIAAAVIEDPENSKNLHSDFLRSLDRGH